jgi:hypothetical protein
MYEGSNCRREMAELVTTLNCHPELAMHIADTLSQAAMCLMCVLPRLVAACYLVV